MKYVAAETRGLAASLALSPALVDAAVRDRDVYLAASAIADAGIVLGASQCAGRVVDIDACSASGVPILRRASSGTALYVGSSTLHFALAMPRLTALFADASPGTVINRNVRGFLRALTDVGAIAHYFGREWIAVDHRPAALLGCDVRDDGGVLLEVFIALETPIGIPETLCAEAERTLDRWRGKVPVALGARIAQRGALDAAARIAERVAIHHNRRLEPTSAPDLPAVGRIIDPHDPAPSGMHLGTPVPCAIGFVEAAVDGAEGTWLGGDALAGRALLAHLAIALCDDSAVVGPLPGLIGARVEDYRAALRVARTSRG